MTPSAQGTILVVDDDPQVRSLLHRLLTQHGHAVATAADGAEAMREIVYHRPDLVLLDVGPPDTEGITVCHQLKEAAATRDLPVVLMSASVDLAGPWRASGADALVRKPFDRDELLVHARTLVRGRAALRTEV